MGRSRGRVYGIRKRGNLEDVAELDARAIVQKYEGLVRYIAKRVHIPDGAPFDREDLLSMGRVALLQAHVTFEAGRGVKFLTWAHRLVRQALLDAVRNVRERARVESDMGENFDLDHYDAGVVPQDVELVEQREVRWLRAKLANGLLTERERSIMRMRLSGATLSSIGEQHGVSREWIRLTEKHVTERLRQAAAQEGVV